MDKDETKNMLTEVELENIRRILDAKIETDEDYAELAKLVEDESDESDNYIDHDFDFGTGG